MFIIEQLKKMPKLRYLLKARILLKLMSHCVSLLPIRHVYSITVGRLVDTMLKKLCSHFPDVYEQCVFFQQLKFADWSDIA